MDPDGTGSRAFGEWLRLSMKELQAAGHPVTLDLEKVNISVTSTESFELE